MVNNEKEEVQSRASSWGG